jgi:uncharacterized protein YraI
MNHSKKLLLGLAVLICAALACVFPGASAEPQVVTVVVTAAPVATQVPTAATQAATASPAASPTNDAQADAATPAATEAAQCSVLKKVNFRNGPGTAYYPVVRSFAAGTILVPSGYNPQGSPSGAWVQVIDPANNQVGWVSAEAEFIACTIDLTILPAVAVQPPPPPPVPMVSNLPAQGPQGGDIDFDVVMSPDFLMRIKAREHGSGQDGDGIDHVLFIIEKNGEQVYTTTEGTAKYCIFKGGEPDCNPWPKSGGRYVWGSDGPEIESGQYQATIRVALKSDPSSESEWTFPITIQLP